MSSSSGRLPSNTGIQIYRVGKPSLLTFDSFQEGVKSPLIQARMRRARQDWKTTDAMMVRSYSYSLAALRIIFDSATLEIIANGPFVDWHVNDLQLPPLEPCSNPCSLIHTDFEDKQEFFDRDMVLFHILGKRIRYAPSPSGLYLISKPNHEIGFYALPLEDQDNFLLHYAGAKEENKAEK